MRAPGRSPSGIRFRRKPWRGFGDGELSVEELAVRQKLYELFAEEFRCTPAESIGRVRLRPACRMLMDPDRKLFTVARESGFGSTLRLHRTFLRRFGQTPGRWRKLAAEGKAASPDTVY